MLVGEEEGDEEFKEVVGLLEEVVDLKIVVFDKEAGTICESYDFKDLVDEEGNFIPLSSDTSEYLSPADLRETSCMKEFLLSE